MELGVTVRWSYDGKLGIIFFQKVLTFKKIKLDIYYRLEKITNKGASCPFWDDQTTRYDDVPHHTYFYFKNLL